MGPTGGWAAFHEEHSRRMVLAVGPPWVVQGTAVLVLLARRPDAVPPWSLALAAVLSAVPVAVTLGLSVPEHVRLGQGWDAAAWQRLLRSNWLRTAAWTAGAVVVAALVAG